MNGVTSTQNIAQNDEIDLMELFFSIWKKKWWVIGITFIFALGSVFYALKAKEQWTSKAEIIHPYTNEIKNITKDKLIYALINEQKVGDIGGELYSYFITELRSINSRVEFFKESSIYKKLSKELNGEKEKQKLLLELANKAISIQWPDKKKEVTYPIVSVSLEDPVDAQQTLKNYMNFLNAKIFELYQNKFLVNLDNQLIKLSYSINKMEERLPLDRKISIERRLKNLQQALATAKAAGIKEYAETDNVSLWNDETNHKKVKSNESIVLMPGEKALQSQISTRFSQPSQWFLLGEKFLQAQIDNLDKTPLVFPKEYYHQKAQLKKLIELKNEKGDYSLDQAFHYQSAPYIPSEIDKPKRALIVLIGTFVGGVLGLLVALFMSGLDSYRRRNS